MLFLIDKNINSKLGMFSKRYIQDNIIFSGKPVIKSLDFLNIDTVFHPGISVLDLKDYLNSKEIKDNIEDFIYVMSEDANSFEDIPETDLLRLEIEGKPTTLEMYTSSLSKPFQAFGKSKMITTFETFGIFGGNSIDLDNLVEIVLKLEANDD